MLDAEWIYSRHSDKAAVVVALIEIAKQLKQLNDLLRIIRPNLHEIEEEESKQ